MQNKNSILDRYKSYEDRILANNIIELAEHSKRHFSYRCTNFLDPRQQKIAEDIMELFGDICFYFDGGVENSERKLCIVYNEEYDIDELIPPITILKFTWNNDRKLSHRDFLGSLIGSGIKREIIGDIILREKSAYVACGSEIAQYILYNVSRVGSSPVSVEIAEDTEQKEEKVKLINTTVASLRMDSILSAGFGVARAKATDAIKAGKIRLNWEETQTPSKEVKAGDTISLRGKGRIVLEEVAGTTRKDRIRVTIKKFI